MMKFSGTTHTDNRARWRIYILSQMVASAAHTDGGHDGDGVPTAIRPTTEPTSADTQTRGQQQKVPCIHLSVQPSSVSVVIMSTV